MVVLFRPWGKTLLISIAVIFAIYIIRLIGFNLEVDGRYTEVRDADFGHIEIRLIDENLIRADGANSAFLYPLDRVRAYYRDFGIFYVRGGSTEKFVGYFYFDPKRTSRDVFVAVKSLTLTDSAGGKIDAVVYNYDRRESGRFTGEILLKSYNSVVEGPIRYSLVVERCFDDGTCSDDTVDGCVYYTVKYLFGSFLIDMFLSA